MNQASSSPGWRTTAGRRGTPEGHQQARRVPARQNRPRPGSCSLAFHDGAEPHPSFSVIVPCPPLPRHPDPARISYNRLPGPVRRRPPANGRFQLHGGHLSGSFDYYPLFILFRHVLVRHHPPHYSLHPAPAPAGAHAAGPARAAGSRRGPRLGGHRYGCPLRASRYGSYCRLRYCKRPVWRFQAGRFW